MQQLGDIIARKNFEEPAEITIIKEFIKESFDTSVAVSLSEKIITIHAPSAAMAGALRPHLYTIKEMCQTNKRLIIRIG